MSLRQAEILAAQAHLAMTEAVDSAVAKGV